MARAKRLRGIVCCIGGMLCCQSGNPQATPDADALVKKMLQTYRAASTLRDEAQATINDPKLGRYEQRSVVIYQKPNRLYFSSVDPFQGTITNYCNGRLIALYSGKQNIFTRRNAPDTLAKTVTLSERAMEDSLRVGVTQLLNPLSFLTGNGTIREAMGFKIVGKEMVAGYKTYKVKATANPAWLEAMMPRSKVQFAKKEITLWIDIRRSYLITVSAQLAWKAFLPANGVSPARTVPGGISFEETHRSTVLNAAVKEEEFRFVAPNNAKEIFQERRN